MRLQEGQQMMEFSVMTKILLIEDEASVREMLMDELTEQGHDVIEAQNGEEGLRKFLESEPDIVLCDRAMPGMSGFDVLERIRGAHPQFNDVPFVFLTALADPRDRAAVDHLKPAAYLTKPVDFNALTEKIRVLTGK
jgi:DNA-binding response OmpR family regulator